MYILAYDIGGTKIEAQLIEFFEGSQIHKKKIGSSAKKIETLDRKGHPIKGQLLGSARMPTERLQGYEKIITKCAKLAKDLCSSFKVNIKDIAGLGLSVPGPVHPESDLITSSNSMVFVGHAPHKDLKSALNLSCVALSENDANCFALAEVLCGAGLAYFKKTGISIYDQSAVGLILGSGFGSGVIHKGEIISGRRGGTGEIGHMILYHEGFPCYCGRLGCAEQYVCGPAIEASMNNRLYAQIHGRPSAKEIFELYQKKDPIALAVVKKYRVDLARHLGTVACFFDPHYFVFGGGMSLQDAIYEDLDVEIGRCTYLPKESVDVYKHFIGDSAGGIGAALKVFQKIS